MSNYGKWDSNFDLVKFTRNFRFSCIFGLGLWPFATILCMSEVKLGSPGLYKGLRAVGSHLRETASGFSIFATIDHVSSEKGPDGLKMSAERQ